MFKSFSSLLRRGFLWIFFLSLSVVSVAQTSPPPAPTGPGDPCNDPVLGCPLDSYVWFLIAVVLGTIAYKAVKAQRMAVVVRSL